MSGPAPSVTLSDRFMKAFRSLVREEFPRLTFFGIYEYVVQAVASNGSTADLSPTDTTVGLPSEVKVPLRLPITSARLPLGSKVLVVFINGDPTRAAVIAADPTPTTSTLDASQEVDVGPSAGLVALAGGASAVALGPKVDAALSALSTWVTATQSIIASCTGPAPGVQASYSISSATAKSALSTTTGAAKTKAT